MENFKTIIMSMALIAMFSYAALNFGFTLQNANSVNVTILDDPHLKSFNKSIRGDIDEFTDRAVEAQFNATLEEQGEEQAPQGEITLGAIFHSISTFFVFILGVGGSVLTLGGLIGIDVVMQGLMIGILSVLAILLAWRLYKAG